MSVLSKNGREFWLGAGKAAHWAYKERPANPGAPGISKPHEILSGDPVLQVGAGKDYLGGAGKITA